MVVERFALIRRCGDYALAVEGFSKDRSSTISALSSQILTFDMSLPDLIPRRDTQAASRCILCLVVFLLVHHLWERKGRRGRATVELNESVSQSVLDSRKVVL